MVYIRKNIQAKRRSDIEPPNAEVILCVELQLNKRKILICNCYRAPHFTMLDFCAILSTLVEDNITEFKEIVFIGDMNGRHSIFWNGDVTNTDGRQLQAFFLQYGFKICIHEPTRISGLSRSCIDLIFSNSNLLIRGAGVRDKIVDVCDHCPIYASIRCNLKKARAYKRWVWHFNRGNSDYFRMLIFNAPWRSCYDGANVNSTVVNWMNMLMLIAKTCIPHYQTTIRLDDKLFMNSDIRKLMRKRDRLRRIYLQTNDENIRNEYKRQRNLVVHVCLKSPAQSQMLKHLKNGGNY